MNSGYIKLSQAYKNHRNQLKPINFNPLILFRHTSEVVKIYNNLQEKVKATNLFLMKYSYFVDSYFNKRI
jgi:hypothetical protein